MVSKIDALAEVVRDEKREQVERDAALAALRDIAATAETGHERQSAAHVLKSISGIPESDSEISDYLLRLVYLADASDTPENNSKARELWREQIKASSQ